MAQSLFSGRILAVLYDCDDTLIPGYQQDPIFAEYGINAGEFWGDTQASVAAYAEQGIDVNVDTVYLLTFLSWVQAGRMPGLSNEKLREFGTKMKFHPGMPKAMKQISAAIENDPRYAALGIRVEHYVISQGLRQLLLGSPLAEVATKIYGCEFAEQLPPAGFASSQPATLGRVKVPSREIAHVANGFGSTDKTRALFEISKGTAVDPSIGVNDAISEDDRRIPMRDIIYVGDGPTDVPVWSILNKAGGGTLAVYNPASQKHLERALDLERQGRIQHVSPCDFRPNRDAQNWLISELRLRADRMVSEVQAERAKRIGKAGGHINVTPPPVLPKGRSQKRPPTTLAS